MFLYPVLVKTSIHLCWRRLAVRTLKYPRWPWHLKCEKGTDETPARAWKFSGLARTCSPCLDVEVRGYYRQYLYNSTNLHLNLPIIARKFGFSFPAIRNELVLMFKD